MNPAPALPDLCMRRKHGAASRASSLLEKLKDLLRLAWTLSPYGHGKPLNKILWSIGSLCPTLTSKGYAFPPPEQHVIIILLLNSQLYTCVPAGYTSTTRLSRKTSPTLRIR